MWRGTIRVESDDRLHASNWAYWYRDDNMQPTLELDYVTLASRPSTRHKFRIDKTWQRTDQRNNTMERPEPPDKVKDEIQMMFIEQMKVV